MLKLTVRVGESIAIGGPTTMTVQSKSGQEVALVFDAARSVPITRIDPSRPVAGITGKPEQPSPS